VKAGVDALLCQGAALRSSGPGHGSRCGTAAGGATE
jgi:hypothetical protein